MKDKEMMLYIKQNGDCYIDKDCKWQPKPPKDKEKQQLTFEQECSLIANGEDLPQEKQIEEMRETCAMIKDEFVEYYQQKGLTKELNDVMAMFVLKTSFGQRENDVPQVAILNVNNSPQEKIDKYARQYGYEKWSEE